MFPSTMNTKSLGSAKLLAAAAGMALGMACEGAVITWTNTAGNNKFDDKLNWNPNAAVPGAADEAVISLPNAAATIAAGHVTLDTLTLNGLASTALIVDGRNLTTKTTGAITKGELRLHAKAGGGVTFRAETNGISVGNGGMIIMDAPASGGDVLITLPGLINSFKVNAGGELRVRPGAGGTRTIDGDFENAGRLTVDKSLTIRYTDPGTGAAGDVFVTNSGTGTVAANQFLRVVGKNPAISRFTMSGGKIVNAGNIDLQRLSFNYNAGAIRNGADAARGGVNVTECRWSLNQATGLFMKVNGDKSVALTGIPGADQQVYWDSAGAAAPKMTFDVPAAAFGGQNLKVFRNKGRMDFNTGGNAMEFIGGGLNNRVVNDGKMFMEGNGSVTIKEARFVNNKGGTMNVSSDLNLQMNAGEPAAVLPANGGTITFTRNGATLTTDRNLTNKTETFPVGNGGFTMASAGTIAVANGTIKATIVAPGGAKKGVVGGKIDVKQVNVIPPMPAPLTDGTVRDPSMLTFGDDLRAAASSGSFVQANITFVGGYEQEPDSVFDTAIHGLSAATFEVGTIDCIGGLVLGGTMNLFLSGIEPAVGQSFAVARSDAPVAGTFDFGNGVTDLLYPIGGSGTLQFRVNYNVPDFSNPGSYLVTLTAELVPTPGTASLMGLAGLIAARRRR